MSQIAENLADISARIATACRIAGRDPRTVELVAVSKTFPAEAVAEAAAAGQLLFGESRLQEAEPKIAVLPGGLAWHFIGRVQRNKVRRILPLFGTIHAVDSVKLAEFCDRTAAELGLSPQVFVQVNIAREPSKAGFAPDELADGINRIAGLTNLRIQGLMCIPPAADKPGESRVWFRELRLLRDSLERAGGVRLPSLSMGMSGDFEIAVEEGATHVRVGSAIFGARAYRVDGELG
jgi:pyridoxal phosphate enzyme (YggS family)